jgi:hypothetical protein
MKHIKAQMRFITAVMKLEAEVEKRLKKSTLAFSTMAAGLEDSSVYPTELHVIRHSFSPLELEGDEHACIWFDIVSSLLYRNRDDSFLLI